VRKVKRKKKKKMVEMSTPGFEHKTFLLQELFTHQLSYAGASNYKQL
jgi:hypothetical protein